MLSIGYMHTYKHTMRDFKNDSLENNTIFKLPYYVCVIPKNFQSFTETVLCASGIITGHLSADNFFKHPSQRLQIS